MRATMSADRLENHGNLAVIDYHSLRIYMLRLLTRVNIRNLNSNWIVVGLMWLASRSDYCPYLRISKCVCDALTPVEIWTCAMRL